MGVRGIFGRSTLVYRNGGQVRLPSILAVIAAINNYNTVEFRQPLPSTRPVRELQSSIEKAPG